MIFFSPELFPCLVVYPLALFNYFKRKIYKISRLGKLYYS